MIYINSIASISTLHHDIKELIPNALQRRRMSDIVKYGVAVGMECILNAQSPKIDAIITATGLGCLSDSEKFLENIITTDETLLSPTPFIQSTFNTIGGQLAILLNSHAYNNTYTHRNFSFEGALLDATLQLSQKEAENILVGAFDLDTPTLTKLLQRMHIDTDARMDGAFFFLLSTNKTDNSIASLKIPEFIKAADLPDNAKINNIHYQISSAAELFNTLNSAQIPCTLINKENDSASIIRIDLC